MRILNKINPMWFFLAFGIGLCVCYVFTPPPTVVVKFPSPLNAGKTIYHDEDDGSCFAFNAEQVKCDRDSLKQPIPQTE
jgi:hypothetical protein